MTTNPRTDSGITVTNPDKRMDEMDVLEQDDYRASEAQRVASEGIDIMDAIDSLEAQFGY